MKFMNKVLLLPLLLLLSIAAQAQDKYFLPGTYYTPSGEKVTGLIYIGTPTAVHLFFKSDENAHFKKIAIADIKAVVIPLRNDSLVVVTEDNKDDKKYLAEFWCATPVTTFYFKIREDFHPGNPDVALGGPVSKSPGSVLKKFIPMYLDGNTTREITKANYIDVLSKAFADDPALVQKIQNKGFKFKELDEIFDEYKQESTHYKAR
jgi:hypothetical protein